MHLIADRAATICETLEGAIVIKGERITFDQELQQRIMQSVSVSEVAIAQIQEKIFKFYLLIYLL